MNLTKFRVLLLVLVGLTLTQATIYTDLNTCTTCLYQQLSMPYLQWCDKKKTCEDVACSTGGTVITNLFACKQVETISSFNVTIDDLGTIYPRLEVVTHTQQEMLHIYTVNNKLVVNGTEGLVYFNDGNANLQFYITDRANETDFQKMQRMCEGSACFQVIPQGQTKYLYVFNPLRMYETYTITYLQAGKLLISTVVVAAASLLITL